MGKPSRRPGAPAVEGMRSEGVICIWGDPLRDLGLHLSGVCGLREEEEEEEEEKESLFKADAVNEEDPERDRATQVQKTCSAVLHSRRKWWWRCIRFYFEED